MKKYIDDGYVIITTDYFVKKIKDICPNARVLSISPKVKWINDDLGINKYLIDTYYIAEEFVERLKNDNNNVVVEWRSNDYAIAKLKVESGYSDNDKSTTLNEMDLVFKMGQLALEVQENESKSYELDTPYYELGNIVKQAYKDMYSIFKGYYHE